MEKETKPKTEYSHNLGLTHVVDDYCKTINKLDRQFPYLIAPFEESHFYQALCLHYDIDDRGRIFSHDQYRAISSGATESAAADFLDEHNAGCDV